MNKSRDKLVQIVVLSIIILSFGFWSYIPLASFQPLFEFGAIVLILLGLFVFSGRKSNIVMNYKKIILTIIGLRLFSTLMSFFFHDQAIHLSIIAERASLFWLFYFFLHKSKISPTTLLKLVAIVAVIWALLTIIQQLSYPIYAFASRLDENEGIKFRAGVYRFLVRGLHYGVLIGLFYLTLFFTERRKKKYILIFLFFLIAIYFHSARQFIAGYLAASLALVFFLKGKIKWIAIAVAGIFMIVLAFNFEAIFAGYIEQSENDMNEDNIRIFAAYFFGVEYFPHWLCNIFGNGITAPRTAYGKEMVDYIQGILLFHRVDVGIIGSYNQYGIIYCFVILYSFLKVLFSKMRANAGLFVKLYAIYSLLLIILSEYSISNYVVPFFCIYFYLVDCYTLNRKTNNLIEPSESSML